tara:strand:- start:353 stop:511 length:159 start_codon:yes stop_codon:yes gene_type:complete
MVFIEILEIPIITDPPYSTFLPADKLSLHINTPGHFHVSISSFPPYFETQAM